MPVFKLDRGLQTRRDDLDAPIGSLEIAENARYVRGKGALAPGLGRAYVGSTPASSVAGSHADNKIDKLVGLTWDPDTVADDAGTPEPRQILYEGDGVVHTIVPADTHSQAGDAASARTMPDGSIIPVLGATFDTAAFENEFFVAGLGVLKRVAKGDPLYTRWSEVGAAGDLLRLEWGPPLQGVRILRHGLPADGRLQDLATPSTISMDITTRAANEAAGGISPASGFYFYWWTWYNALDDIEGPSNLSPSGKFKGSTTRTIGFLQAGTSNEIWITWPKDYIDQVRPPGARIRVYRSLRIENAAGLKFSGIGTTRVTVLGDTIDPWPIGYLVQELSLHPTEVLTYATGADVNKMQVRQFGNELRYLFRDRDDELVFTTETANQLQAGRKPFEFVSVRLGNKEADADRDGEPPASTSFETFEESLVGNDPSDKRKTRFSFPGRPHSWPGLFYINHESKESDEVVAHRVTRNVLVALLRYGVDRVNWLPRSSDTDFSAGRIVEKLSSERGAVSVKAVDKFVHPRFGELVAFVSDDGVWITDALRPQLLELTRWVDWRRLVGDPTACFLVDDPDNQRLVLAHTRPGAEGAPSGLTSFHYGPEFLDEDGLPAIVGPVTRVRGIVALKRVVTEGGRRQLVSTDDNGSIFYEDVGFEDQATKDLAGNTATPLPMLAVTKQIFPAGLLGEVTIGKVAVKTRGGGALTVVFRSWLRESLHTTERLFTPRSVPDPVSYRDGNATASRVEIAVVGEGDIELSHAEFAADPSVGEAE